MGNAVCCRSSGGIKEQTGVQENTKPNSKYHVSDDIGPNCQKVKAGRVSLSKLGFPIITNKAEDNVSESPRPFHHIIATYKTKKFHEWHKVFKQHAKNSTIGNIHDGMSTFPCARKVFCDEKHTIVFRDVKNTVNVLISFDVWDIQRFGEIYHSDELIKLHEKVGVTEFMPFKLLLDLDTYKKSKEESALPQVEESLVDIDDIASEFFSLFSSTSTENDGDLKKEDDQAAIQPTLVNTANLIIFVEVSDFDWWYNGFMRHATSNTGSWGFVVHKTRSEYVNEALTRVYQGATNRNVVAVLLFRVNLDLFIPLQSNLNYRRFLGSLGEKEKTRRIRALIDEESLDPPIQLDCKMVC